MKSLLNKLVHHKFDNDLKHRILLVLVGSLGVLVFGLVVVIGKMQLQLHDFVVVAKSIVTPTPGAIGKTTPTPAPSHEPSSKPNPGTTSVPTTVPNVTPVGNEPYPGAPACPESAHSNSKFHTLWNPDLRCHYDHEHGENPLTSEVSNVFSPAGMNLYSLLGNVEIGHTNPSSSMENTHKHGGFKWQVQMTTPNDCALGFEDAQVAINAIAMQYHAFGNYDIEFDARVHSAAAIMRQCLPNSTDYGYVYTTQHIDYGQRVSGYQGAVVPFSDNPQPAYSSGLAPYFTIDCIGRSSPPCGRYATYDQYVAANGNTSTTWTSKSPHRITPSGSPLLMLLFRARDTYQILDFRDPIRFLWMCSRDGGATYTSFPGCRYNNTTTRVHEVAGTIPSSWDNLSGFDTDSRVGRITASGYTTRFGTRNPQCTAPGVDCHPIRLVNAYVGRYGSLLHLDKVVSFSRDTLPERDVYFCNGVVCSELSSGARSSGWVGPNN